MPSNAEMTMSKGASQQLGYAAGYRRPALVYGARIDAASLEALMAERTGAKVVSLGQDSAAITAAAAKADALHIACDYAVSEETLDAVKTAMARKPKPPFIVLSSRVVQLSDLDSSVRNVFPIVIAWGEVF